MDEDVIDAQIIVSKVGVCTPENNCLVFSPVSEKTASEQLSTKVILRTKATSTM